MILRELELVNIRSHAHSLIRFPEGKTLLEGDIGSGKSSVLIAIEFALFGLGSDSGGSVLKVGEDEGEVRMVFEVDGSEYQVTRRLQRKSGKVQQSDGYITTPTEKLNLSPSELKEKVLEILEFNEAPDPKAQSWIYRYAVYTPQEEMKAILTLAPEQRLQILRRAFRVEDYKTAATNAEEAGRRIREDARELDGFARGLDELREKLRRLQREETETRSRLSELDEEATSAEANLVSLKEKREEAAQFELSLQGTKAESEYFERVRSDGDRDSAEVRGEIGELRTKLGEVNEGLASTLLKRPPSLRPQAELRRRERTLEARSKKLERLLGTLESKVSDYESIMKNGVCPVCDRPAEAHDFEGRRAKKEAEKLHVAETLGVVEEDLAATRARIQEAEAFVEAKRKVDQWKSERSKLEVEVGRRETAAKKIGKRVAFASERLHQLEASFQEVREAQERTKALGRQVDQAEATLRRARDELVGARKELESIQKQMEDRKVEVAAREEAAGKSGRLKERGIWLDDYFVPTVKTVEKLVLATINQEFDTLFKGWFSMLVPDQDKEVSVDDDFTPVVSQGGYEQDVRYLSGGERTGVALAYRLALNLLAQRMSAGMKSNLLILDEPTDGFSKEQLSNVREVLDEVGCPQVIIVSHDRELESFADQIFRVEKTGGESKVTLPESQGPRTAT